MTADATQASAPSANMPLFYKSLVPLMSAVHRDLVLATSADYRFAAGSNGIPITLDEIAIAQTHYPIVFSAEAEPVPFILTGLPNSGNRFVDEKGNWRADTYIPAYVRRYPFFLAKVDAARDELTLCVDLSSDRVQQQPGKGNLFSGEEPTATAKAALQFCEQFEGAAQRTRAVMAELTRLGLLMDGEAKVQPNAGAPSVYRGFRIVSEEKLQQLSGADLAGLVKSGGLALIYAHLFSLRHIMAVAGPQSDSRN